MEITLTNEINVLDLIGFVGWAVGLLTGASLLRRRYANRIESDPMVIFQSYITDLELIAHMMENSEAGYFTREKDGSEDAQASERVAEAMSNYGIRDMIYNGWLFSCRFADRRSKNPYLHIRRVPGLYIVDPR
jgi:hypothetical protein